MYEQTNTTNWPVNVWPCGYRCHTQNQYPHILSTYELISFHFISPSGWADNPASTSTAQGQIFSMSGTRLVIQWHWVSRNIVKTKHLPGAYIQTSIASNRKGLLPSVRHRGSHNSDKLKGSKHSNSFLARLQSFRQQKRTIIVIKELTKP